MAMSRRARRRLTLLLAGVVIIGASGASAITVLKVQRSRTTAIKRERGLTAYHEGRYSDALGDLGSVFARNRHDYEVTIAIADARRRVPLVNKRHLVNSQAFARTALEINPESKEALEILVDDYTELRQRTELLEQARRLLALDSSSLKAHVGRVQALVALGRDDEALAAVNGMVAALPDEVRAHEMWIAVHSVVGDDVADLLRHAEEAAKEHPENARFAVLLSGIRMRAGDQEGAQSAARDASTMDLMKPEALDAVVRALDRVGLSQEASDMALKRAASLAGAASDKNGRVAMVAVERAWRLGDLQQARQAIQLVTSSRPLEQIDDNILGWIVIVSAQRDQSDAQESNDIDGLSAGARKILALRKTLEAAFWRDVIEGRDAMVAGDWTAARDAFNAAVVRKADDPLPRYLLAQTEAKLGDVEAAAARFGALAAADPTWYSARRQQARALLDLARVEDAHLAARLLLTSYPRRVDAALLVLETGAALAESGAADSQTVDALLQLEQRLASEFSTDQSVVAAAALLRAGRILVASGRLDAFQNTMEKITNWEGTIPVGDVLALARSCARFGAPGEEQLLALAQSRFPDSPDVAFALAQAAASRGDVAAGKAILEEAIAQNKGTSAADEATRRLAVYLDRVGDASAGDVLQRFAQTHPDDARAQIALLNSAATWPKPRVVEETLGRLSAILGKESPTWRVFESRRLLTFEPTRANASQVAQLLASVVSTDPADSMAAALYAQAQLMLDRNVTAAAAALGRAVDAKPDQAALYPTLVMALRESGRLDEALRRLREFSAIASLPAALLRRRASLLLSFALLDDAIRDYETLADSGGAADLAALGRAMAQAGETERASAVYARMMAAGNASVNDLLSAAVFVARQGDAPRAEQILHSAIDRAGDNDADLVRAAYAARVGDFGEAERALRSAIKQDDSEAHRAVLAKLLIRQGRFDDAQTMTDEGIAAWPKGKALKRLSRMIDLSRRSAVDADSIALILETVASAGENDVVDLILDAIESRSDETSEAWIAVGSQLRDLAGAHAEFSPVWALSARYLAQGGSMDQAIIVARDAVGRFPADSRLARLAAELLAAADRTEEAVAMAMTWRERVVANPQAADTFLADMETRRGDASQATRRLQPYAASIIANASNDGPAAEVLLRAYVAAGDTEAALDATRQLTAQDERWWGNAIDAANTAPSAAARLWLHAIEAEMPEASLQKRKRAIAFAWQQQASETGVHEDFVQVVRLLRQSAVNGTLDAGEALLYAASLENLGELTDAERWYRDAIRQAPESDAALNNLSYLLVKINGDASEAVAFARRAVAARDKRSRDAATRANYLDTLGVALLARGDAEEARLTFQEAIAEFPPGPTSSQLGMAEALAALGRRAEAVQVLRDFDSRYSMQSVGDSFLRTRHKRLRTLLGDDDPTTGSG